MQSKSQCYITKRLRNNILPETLQKQRMSPIILFSCNISLKFWADLCQQFYDKAKDKKKNLTICHAERLNKELIPCLL